MGERCTFEFTTGAASGLAAADRPSLGPDLFLGLLKSEELDRIRAAITQGDHIPVAWCVSAHVGTSNIQGLYIRYCENMLSKIREILASTRVYRPHTENARRKIFKLYFAIQHPYILYDLF
jgi:hypothetical protein